MEYKFNDIASDRTISKIKNNETRIEECIIRLISRQTRKNEKIRNVRIGSIAVNVDCRSKTMAMIRFTNPYHVEIGTATLDYFDLMD